MALTVKVIVVGELSTNCYFVIDDRSHTALVIDPGDAPEYISDILLKEKLAPVGILATHGHFDHILGAFGLQTAFNIPFYIHLADEFLVRRVQESGQHFLKRNNVDPAPVITNPLHDGDRIAVGHGGVRIMHVPGHTPGSVAIEVEGAHAVIVGDGLFADGTLGRTDTSYGDKRKLEQSIRHILQREKTDLLYPGHGVPLTIDRAKFMFGI